MRYEAIAQAPMNRRASARPRISVGAVLALSVRSPATHSARSSNFFMVKVTSALPASRGKALVAIGTARTAYGSKYTVQVKVYTASDPSSP